MTDKVDSLHLIIDEQKFFQKNILKNDIHSQQFINDMALALCAEVYEALGATPWKPWKKQQTLDTEGFKKEVIDVFIFTMNLVIATGMDHFELCKLYREKMDINIKRQKENY